MKFSQNGSELILSQKITKKDAFNRTTHLAIAAHPDDVEFMAYPGIYKCFESDDFGFSAIIVTNGGKSPKGGIYVNCTDNQMMEIRKEEQKKAAFMGKYLFLALLMHESSNVKDKGNDIIINEIYDVLLRAKPEIVYTHNLADNHETHVAVVIKVIKAIRKMPKVLRPKFVYGCEVWGSLDWILPKDKVIFDSSQNPDLAMSLMDVFDSQISGGKNYAKATFGRRMANATYCKTHDIDDFEQACYAMDLTPLILDDDLSMEGFVLNHINNFMLDIKDKIKKFN